MKSLVRAQLFVFGVLLVAGLFITFSQSTPPGAALLWWPFVILYAAASASFGWLSRRHPGRFVAAQLGALIVAVALTGPAVHLYQRLSMHADPRVPLGQRRMGAELGPDAVGHCLELQRWWWVHGPEGHASVVAEVLPGRAGTLALDARATRGRDEDVWAPAVLMGKLERTPVVPGRTVRLERELRRVAPGAYDGVTLRFSCRPEGPSGVFGVVAYVSASRAGTLEGTRDVVRPLPEPAPASRSAPGAQP